MLFQLPKYLIFNVCKNLLADLVLKDDSTKHVIEASIVAVGLATAEGFSSMNKTVQEDPQEATPETGNDSIESGTPLDLEPSWEDEVDVTTAPATEGIHPDIDSSLHNDPTPVLLALEPESSLIETELVTEREVETISTETTEKVPIDVEVQPGPSLGETALYSQKDIEEKQTQVYDATNIKDEPKSNILQYIESTDTEDEGPIEYVAASSTKEFQSIVQIEPKTGFVTLAEEESSAITQVAWTPNPSPKEGVRKSPCMQSHIQSNPCRLR